MRSCGDIAGKHLSDNITGARKMSAEDSPISQWHLAIVLNTPVGFVRVALIAFVLSKFPAFCLRFIQPSSIQMSGE